MWDYGEPSREWFVAAHGLFVAALCEFIVQARGEALAILPLGVAALPFRTFRAEDFRAEGGWLVSAALSRGALTLRIRNPLAARRTLPLIFPGGRTHELDFEPGASRIVKGRP